MLNRSSGILFGEYGNSFSDYTNIDRVTTLSESSMNWGYRLDNGITNNPSVNNIDPNNYSNGGVLTPVSNKDWQIKRLFIRADGGANVIYYGDEEYNNYTDAEKIGYVQKDYKNQQEQKH